MTRRPLPRGAAGLALAFGLGACASARIPLPTPEIHPEPAPAEVERVLFLVGDPGKATTATSPLLQRLAEDVEEWSARLARDSAVAVIVLGDIVYPLGLHPPGSRWFDHDTAIVMSQVRLVAGPNARARGTAAYFVAGNHDWGLREDYPGARRLARLALFLESAGDAAGTRAHLVPEPGSGGPWVWDWGPHVRLLLLDTAWWLLGAEEAGKAAFLARIEEAMRTAGDREVVFAAHHPFRAVGPHGGGGGVWYYLGVYTLLRNAGVLLQDLNSRPYRELERGLRDIFARTGPPFAFIGGHEHSLHLLQRVEPTDPRYSIVAGSGSKLTGVGFQPGLRFARSAPGYMRLLILEDGRMHLTTLAIGEQYLLCPEGPRQAACMAAGIAAFEKIQSEPLR